MVSSITDVLNIWNNMGVFSYVIPFLLIFAVVFALLKKTKVLSGANEENNGILAIISVAAGLLALQFDFVSEFYAVIFPRFGIGLSVFLVLIILIGFFYPGGTGKDGVEKLKWIGYVVGVGVVLWAISSWDSWGYFGFGGWFEQNFWALVVLGVIIAVIGLAVGKGGTSSSGG